MKPDSDTNWNWAKNMMEKSTNIRTLQKIYTTVTVATCTRFGQTDFTNGAAGRKKAMFFLRQPLPHPHGWKWKQPQEITFWPTKLREGLHKVSSLSCTRHWVTNNAQGQVCVNASTLPKRRLEI